MVQTMEPCIHVEKATTYQLEDKAYDVILNITYCTISQSTKPNELMIIKFKDYPETGKG